MAIWPYRHKCQTMTSHVWCSWSWSTYIMHERYNHHMYVCTALYDYHHADRHHNWYPMRFFGDAMDDHDSWCAHIWWSAALKWSRCIKWNGQKYHGVYNDRRNDIAQSQVTPAKAGTYLGSNNCSKIADLISWDQGAWLSDDDQYRERFHQPWLGCANRWPSYGLTPRRCSAHTWPDRPKTRSTSCDVILQIKGFFATDFDGHGAWEL